MSLRKKPFNALLLFGIFSFSIFSSFAAKAQTMEDLNIGSGKFDEIPTASSSDGSVIVGYAFDDYPYDFVSFRNQNNNTTLIENQDGFSAIGLYDVSGDGSIAVGQATIGGNIRAVTYQNGVLTDFLGFDSTAEGISNDGSVITGNSSYAYKYENNVITDLGTLGGTSSYADEISGDGLVVIGNSHLAGDASFHAFKHTAGEGMVDLGTLGGADSFAFDASYDGSIIVGRSEIEIGELTEHAYYYTDEEGMVDLGTLGGSDSAAYGISRTGKLIVGDSNLAGDLASRAFKYTKEGGMVDLGTLGGTNSIASGVSSDGSAIFGYSEIAGDAEFHAFVIRGDAIDANPNLVDVNNTISVLTTNANQLNSVLNLSESLVNYSLNQDAKLFGKNGLHMSVGSRLALVDNSREVGSIFKLAYRGNDHFRIGAFIDYGFGDDLPNNFQLKRTAPLASIFAVLSEDKDDIGLSLRLAASYNSSNLDVSRSVLTNTEAGKGRTNLISKGVLVQVGYGFKLNDVLKLQPYAGVRFSEISRNAYTETSGADFPITFAKARKKSTTALLGLNFEMALTQKLSANLGAGFERDLSASLDGYAGNISYLGSFDLTPKTLREKRYFSNVGLGYKITPNQEVAFSVNYTKQSLASSDAVVAYFNYSVGF